MHAAICLASLQRRVCVLLMQLSVGIYAAEKLMLGLVATSLWQIQMASGRENMAQVVSN